VCLYRFLRLRFPDSSRRALFFYCEVESVPFHPFFFGEVSLNHTPTGTRIVFFLLKHMSVLPLALMSFFYRLTI